MSRPSGFPAEFRARGVQLYRDSEGRTIAEVARELGVGAETFRKWVRQDEVDRGEAPDKPTSAQLAELARLKKDNAELRRTNEICGWRAVFSPRRPTRPVGGREVRGSALRGIRGGAVVPGVGAAGVDVLRPRRSAHLGARGRRCRPGGADREDLGGLGA